MSHLVFPVNHEQWNRAAIQHVPQADFTVCQRQFRFLTLGDVLETFHGGDEAALIVMDRSSGEVQPLTQFRKVSFPFQKPFSQLSFTDACRVMPVDLFLLSLLQY